MARVDCAAVKMVSICANGRACILVKELASLHGAFLAALPGEVMLDIAMCADAVLSPG